MARNIFVRGSGFQERGILGAETPLQCGRVVKEKEFKGDECMASSQNGLANRSSVDT